MHWVEQAPLLVIGLAISAALGLTHGAALWIGRRWRLKLGRAETRGYLVTAALALLSLLTAFTFGAAQDRFKLRQDLVVAEANAIGTSYLRFQLLDPQWRDDLSRQMAHYAEARVRLAKARTAAEMDANARETAALQDRLWRDLASALRANSVPGLHLALMQPVNEAFDLAASRRAAREARVPVAIVRSLFLCSLTIAAIIGYTEAGERRDPSVLIGVLLLITLAFCLILDLDRPRSGSVIISEAPLERALADIQRSEASRPAPAPALRRPAEPGPRRPNAT